MALRDDLTLIAGALSGRVGSDVFSHNTHGPYSYTWNPHIDADTSLQRHVRNTFASLAQNWLPYNPSWWRERWETYARNVPVINRLGQQITVSGFNAYIGVNTFRKLINLYVIPLAPDNYTLGQLSPPSFRLSLPPYTTIRVRFDLSDPWRSNDNAGYGAFISLPQPPTVNHYTGPFRILGTAAGNSSNPPVGKRFNLPVAPTSGQSIFFRSRISEGDGRLSPPIVQRVEFP